MKGLQNKITFVFILIFSFQSISLSEINDAAKFLEDNVINKRLSNGISIIVLNRGYTPTLSLNISFKVGSVDESYRNIGTAHMLEHMLFKGTDKIGTKNFEEEKGILYKIEEIGEILDKLKLGNPEEKRIADLQKQLDDLQRKQRKYTIHSPYDKIYSVNGGIGLNASTSRDRTSYYIELPASKLELWAKIESERLRNPVMREYYIERNAVMEERLMRYESKGTSNLFEKFTAVAILAHPYRHPTIGWNSNIRHLSIKGVKSFYKDYYVPSRMTITIVGMLDVEETMKALDKYFGKIEMRDEPSEISINEPEQKGERRVEINFESNPYLIIGWHKPTFPSRTDYVCDIISEVLTDGKTSRLYKSLALEKKIASSVDSWNGFPGARYDNLFIITAKPKHPHTPEEVENCIYEEVERLKSDIAEDELESVLNRIESSMIFDLDSNRGVSNYLSYYQTVFGDWHYIVDYLKVVKTIGAQEVKKVIEKYFIKENRTVGILRNSKE